MRQHSVAPVLQSSAPICDRAEELRVLSWGIDQMRVVTVDRVVGQRLQVRYVVTSSQEFKGPDPKVTRCDACRNCSSQRGRSVYRFAGRNDRETTRGGNSEGCHGFADDVLA